MRKVDSAGNLLYCLKGILNGDDEIAATAVLKRGYKKTDGFEGSK
jgi:hypothetical protein